MSKTLHVLLAGSFLLNIVGALVVWHNSHTIEIQSKFNREMRLTLAQLREQSAKNRERIHELEEKTANIPSTRR